MKITNNYLRAFDYSLWLVIAVGLTSLISGKNIFARELPWFIVLFVGLWIIRYLLLRNKARKS